MALGAPHTHPPPPSRTAPRPSTHGLTSPTTPLAPPGVIWKGDKIIEGVPETLDMLRGMVTGAAPLMATPPLQPPLFYNISLVRLAGRRARSLSL